MSANLNSQLSSFIDSSLIQGRFPFSKNSGLKFQKFHAPNGTVHFACTDPTQAAARLVIVLVSRRQKIDTGVNNFVKWKGTFRSDRPKWPDWSKWATLKAGSEYCGQTKPKLPEFYNLNGKRPKREEMITITTRFLRFVILLSQRYKF